jgi:hypothetical protein
MRKILPWLLLVIVGLTACNQALACTIFNANQGDFILVGNNEDNSYAWDAKVWFVPPAWGNYGKICFGGPLDQDIWYLSLLGDFTQGGMNDQGLFVDAASCPESKAPVFPGKPMLIYVMDKFLEKCANVEEVIKMAHEYNIPFNYPGANYAHLMFADKSGRSIVVEWTNNKVVIIRKKGPYQVITNFWLSVSPPDYSGYYPGDRYDQAVEMFKNNHQVSVPFFIDILDRVAARCEDKKSAVGTLYSNIYDLKNGIVYVYYKYDFKKPIVFNLREELKKGKHTYRLSDLFKR